MYIEILNCLSSLVPRPSLPLVFGGREGLQTKLALSGETGLLDEYNFVWCTDTKLS